MIAGLAASAVCGGIAAALAQSSGTVACGAATASTVVNDDRWAAEVIYREERHGLEVSADSAHITGAADLAAAVASDDAAVTLVQF